MRTNTLLSLVFVAAAATSAGCDTYAEVPVVEITSAPVVTGPYVIYAGRPHYWYHNHWYYRDDAGRWYYYHHEPAELHAYRHYYRRHY